MTTGWYRNDPLSLCKPFMPDLKGVHSCRNIFERVISMLIRVNKEWRVHYENVRRHMRMDIAEDLNNSRFVELNRDGFTGRPSPDIKFFCRRKRKHVMIGIVAVDKLNYRSTLNG